MSAPMKGWIAGVVSIAAAVAAAVLLRGGDTEPAPPPVITGARAPAAAGTADTGQASPRARATRALETLGARTESRPQRVDKRLGRDRAPTPPGVLGFEDLIDRDREALTLMQDAFGPDAAVNGAADECLRAWVGRGGSLSQDYNWSFHLHVASDGKRARVLEVSSDDWPDAFDDDLRACYVRAYRQIWFNAEHAFDYVVSYPMCLKRG